MDELTTNQITAALYERARLLQRAIKRLEGQPVSPDQAFALECNQTALEHTNRALLEVSRRLPTGLVGDDEPEQADPITASKAASDRDYHGWQAQGPA